MGEVCDGSVEFLLHSSARRGTLSNNRCIEAEALGPGTETGAIKLHGGLYYIRRPRVRQQDWVNLASDGTACTAC
jgi:hypothetical protein